MVDRGLYIVFFQSQQNILPWNIFDCRQVLYIFGSFKLFLFDNIVELAYFNFARLSIKMKLKFKISMLSFIGILPSSVLASARLELVSSIITVLPTSPHHTWNSSKQLARKLQLSFSWVASPYLSLI